MSGKALICLAEGFEEIEAITVIDLLRRADIAVTLCGLDSLDIRGCHNITLKADMLLKDIGECADAFILPGGMPGTTNLSKSPSLLDMVKKHFSAGKLCAALCAAPIVLAQAGILAGKQATCYPGYESLLTGAHVSDRPVVIDGAVITSRGVGTAIPFALAIIEYLTHKNNADTVASKILYNRHAA